MTLTQCWAVLEWSADGVITPHGPYMTESESEAAGRRLASANLSNRFISVGPLKPDMNPDELGKVIGETLFTLSHTGGHS